jgi:signal peptidase II
VPVLAADQVSKALVMSVNSAGSAGRLIPVRPVRNTGASSGTGAGHPLLITPTAAAVLAVAVLLLARVRNRAVALSPGAVTGGAAGNLADRLLRGPGPGRGAVVDWLHVAGYPATFNIADIAIRLGALCAVIAALRPAPRNRTRAARRHRISPGRLVPRFTCHCRRWRPSARSGPGMRKTNGHER